MRNFDAMRIRITISSSHKWSKRRHPKKQERHEDSQNISPTEDFTSNFTLPEDYFQSINCSSGYGSAIISNPIKEDEEIPRDRYNTEQETGTTSSPEHNPRKYTLKK